MAEFGLGMFKATKHRRSRLIAAVEDYIHEVDLKEEAEKSADEKALVSLLHDWREICEEKSDRPTLLFDKMKPLLQALLPKGEDPANKSLLSRIWDDRDQFPKISQWICGGDG